jgi:hypothetical protein
MGPDEIRDRPGKEGKVGKTGSLHLLILNLIVILLPLPIGYIHNVHTRRPSCSNPSARYLTTFRAM